MRIKGEVFRYEVDSISGKIKVKGKEGSPWVVIREKEDLLRFASDATRKEGNF